MVKGILGSFTATVGLHCLIRIYSVMSPSIFKRLNKCALLLKQFNGRGIYFRSLVPLTFKLVTRDKHFLYLNYFINLNLKRLLDVYLVTTIIYFSLSFFAHYIFISGNTIICCQIACVT